MPDTKQVALTPGEIDDAYNLAKERHERAVQVHGEGDNAFANHLTGSLGEVAFEKLCRELGLAFDSAFRDSRRDREADVFISCIGVDVKTQSVAGAGPRYPRSRCVGSVRRPAWSSGQPNITTRTIGMNPCLAPSPPRAPYGFTPGVTRKPW
jgi:hypothetical protein